MTHYDIFREQLAIKYPAYGYALWEPSPSRTYDVVEVGDVGFIREGRFHRLFNALLSVDHPSHKFGVPEYHEPLIPKLSDHIIYGVLSPGHYYSAGIDMMALEPDVQTFGCLPYVVQIFSLLIFSQPKRLPAGLIFMQKQARRRSIVPSNTGSTPGHSCSGGFWQVDGNARRSMVHVRPTA